MRKYLADHGIELIGGSTKPMAYKDIHAAVMASQHALVDVLRLVHHSKSCGWIAGVTFLQLVARCCA
jgi:hypothetical protein